VLRLRGGVLCGGASQSEVTQEIRDLCGGLTASVQQQTQALGRNGIVTEVEPVAVLTQVVAGVNYFIKARIGGESSTEHVHLRVHRSPGASIGEAELAAVQVQKSAADELTYFEA